MTDDCIKEYRRMKDAGVKFHGEPQVQPYGTGVMLEDLYENRIYLNQEPDCPAHLEVIELPVNQVIGRLADSEE